MDFVTMELLHALDKEPIDVAEERENYYKVDKVDNLDHIQFESSDKAKDMQMKLVVVQEVVDYYMMDKDNYNLCHRHAMHDDNSSSDMMNFDTFDQMMALLVAADIVEYMEVE